LGKAHIGSDLLDVAFFEDFAKKFVGLHAAGLTDCPALANHHLFPTRKVHAGSPNGIRSCHCFIRENLTVFGGCP
jgi:hypothetical protein